jgi:Mn-dependent DtxR family transcriptional regulator
MPIPKDRFDAIDNNGVSPQTNAEKIVEFLLRNQDLAYRMSEIAEELDIPQGSVGPTLNRLEEDGLVVHRDRYWAIDDSYAATREGLALTSATATEYDDGKEFDVEAWIETAEDQSGDSDS